MADVRGRWVARIGPVLRRFGMVAIAASVVVGACTPAAPAAPTAGGVSSPPVTAVAGPDDPATLVQQLRAEPFGEANITAAARILALAGVATLDDESAQPLAPVTEPAAPITFASFQVQRMAAEVAEGSGIPGRLIDDAAPLPGDGTEMSAVIAAYTESDLTFGARVARELMGEATADPAATTYPMLVLALAVADITAAQPPGAGSTAPRVRFASTRLAAVPADPCEYMVATWQINSALVAIVGTLPGGVNNRRLQAILDILGRSGLDYAGGGEPLRREIVKDLVLINVVLDIRSALRHWRSSIEAEPAGPIHYTVQGQAPQPVTLTVSVEAPLGDRPNTPSTACLQALGLELPRDDAVGSKITWHPFGKPQLPVIARQDQTVPEQSPGARVYKATMEFLMPIETAAAHERGEERTGTVSFLVGVDRQDRKALQQFVFEITERISRLQPEFNAIVGPLRDKLFFMTEVSRHHEIAATYHEEPQETPPPPSAVMVRYDRAPAEGVLPLTIVEFYSCTGAYGRWIGNLRTGNLSNQGLAVPTTDLPVDFRFPGAGGRQVVSGVTVDGTVDMPDPLNDVPLHYVFDVATDGRTMSITGLPVAVAAAADLAKLPIQPAPAGVCPGG